MKSEVSEPHAPKRLPVEPSIQFLCPQCEEMFLYTAGDLQGRERLTCSHCRLEFKGMGKASAKGAPISRCWVCGNGEFYVQKDFNRQLGFMIVLGSAMIVFLIMLLIDHILGIFCLMGIALVDFVIYRLLANVTVCYLCQSIYRGFPLDPGHRGFYLGQEEKYKKLRREWLKSTLGESR